MVDSDVPANARFELNPLYDQGFPDRFKCSATRKSAREFDLFVERVDQDTGLLAGPDKGWGQVRAQRLFALAWHTRD